MVDPIKLKQLEKITWWLIFGGMFAATLGYFTERESEATGWVLMIAGAAAIATGVVLVYARSRMKPD